MNAQEENGRTPLWYATEDGFTSTVKILIRRGIRLCPVLVETNTQS